MMMPHETPEDIIMVWIRVRRYFARDNRRYFFICAYLLDVYKISNIYSIIHPDTSFDTVYLDKSCNAQWDSFYNRPHENVMWWPHEVNGRDFNRIGFADYQIELWTAELKKRNELHGL